MNRYARITTRKGRFIIDLNEKDSRGIITVLREGAALGEFEKLAEIPMAPRPDVIKAVTKIVTYLEAAHDLQSVDGVKLLAKAVEPQRVETLAAPKKGKARRRGRESVWS